MTPLRKGLLLAVLHLLIVSSLGAKLLIDRAARPRVWVRTAPYDPDLPIRGRYVSLQLEVEAPVPPPPPMTAEGKPDSWRSRVWERARLEVRDSKLFAVPDQSGSVQYMVRWQEDAWARALLHNRVAFFIPENISDPSARPPGEELWVEVTVPKKGPPRPIRLGVKKGEQLTPLEID